MTTLEKRTYDSRVYDINCTDLLDLTETITVVNSISADQGGVAFGSPTVNSALITYADGTTAPIGKAIQVSISAGAIPAGYADIVCLIRVRFATNVSTAIEATVKLRLTDQPAT